MRWFFVPLMTGGSLLLWAIAGASLGEESDSALMQRIAAGDTQAFERMYRRHSGAVFALLVRVSGDRGTGEDLLQEVFLTLWRQASRYDAAATSALPWLLVVARNRALDRVRSAARRREESHSDEELERAAQTAGAGAGFEAGLWQGMQVERIRSFMAGLSPEERQVLELAYFEGCSQSEISARTGAPLGTVKTWTRNALAKLRQAVG